jgi:senataxin
LDKGPSKKILLCAPSNAAIDEVAYRIKRGPHKSKVVRVGADKTINIAVKDISLDALIEQKMNSEKIISNDSSNAIAALREEIESIKRLKQEKYEEVAKVRDNAARTLALQDEIRKLNSQRMALSSNFDKLKDKQKSDSRSLDATRRKFRADILSNADIICSTLSGAGHELLEHFEYEMLIIDEAAQAIELSSLIPLRYTCKSCIMVGGAYFVTFVGLI